MAENTETYDKILTMFAKRDMYRPWMAHPFIIENSVIATDASRLVKFHRSLTDTFYDYIDKFLENQVLFVLDKPRIPAFFISVDALKEVISKVGMVDCYDKKEIKCEACEGTSEVDFVFEYRGKEHTIVDDCPVCWGSGISHSENYANGKKTMDLTQIIQIKESCLSVKDIALLIEVAEMLKEETINLVSQMSAIGGNIFTIGEIEVLIMPVIPNNKPCFEIK